MEHHSLGGLEQHLNDVRVEQVGCVALFSGRA
jgi:hypothetical protein